MLYDCSIDEARSWIDVLKLRNLKWVEYIDATGELAESLPCWFKYALRDEKTRIFYKFSTEKIDGWEYIGS